MHIEERQPPSSNQPQLQKFAAAFAAAFAEDLDLIAAAEQAGISLTEAAELLREVRMREQIEERIVARRAGETLSHIWREYERIAFHDDEDAKPGDRLRALEQLRLIASSERGDGAAPSLVIRCEYV